MEPKQNVHYICTGSCHGVSPKPGTCQAKDCKKHGKPLTRCECEDGEDDETFHKATPKS